MRIITFVCSFLLLLSVSNAQNWQFIEESSILQKEGLVRELIPSSYKTLELDLEAMSSTLDQAPKSIDSDNPLIIMLPMPEGNLMPFSVIQSSCMSSVLNAKYPMIKSWKAFDLENPKINARIDISQLGLRASIRTDQGQVYIDPYANGMMENYITYYIKNHQDPLNQNAHKCGTEGADLSFIDDAHLPEDLYALTRDPLKPVEMRTYRLAFSCTGEWGSARSSVANALSVMNTGVNRLNQIFENELALRFEMVDNNDLLIHLDGTTDPYFEPAEGRSLIGQNTAQINQLIGSESYDLGHIFAHCTDVGGVAFLGSICQGNKGGGATCFFGSNVTGVAVNIIAHEMGHQMRANHTMSSCVFGNPNADPPQISPTSAYEIGSGTTIMSYAGACTTENIQNFNYDTYHVHSLQEMFSYTRGGPGDCGVITETGNTSPEAIAPYKDGFYIPISTPFELTGEANDPDGDALLYSWEQYNIGPVALVGTPFGNSPLFRTYLPSTEKTRVFPKLGTVLNNGFDDKEYLPDYSRDMNFRFIVRDNNPAGGGTEWDEVAFSATDEAGPFRVLFPNQFEQFGVGDTITVEWDVANTDGTLVNAQEMSIYLSTDAGQTREYLLATRTPNDGSEDVVIPNYVGDLNRIYVLADENIFFDVSNSEFRITAPTTAGIFVDVSPKYNKVCLPEVLTYTLKSEALLGYSENVHYEVIDGLPTGAIATFDQNDVASDSEVQLTIDLGAASGTGTYDVIIEATSGIIVKRRKVQIVTTGTDFTPLALLSPDNNQAGLPGAPDFSWVEVPDADYYTLQLSTSPDFTDTNLIFEEKNILENFYSSSVFLEKNSQYFWRVAAHNQCKEGQFTKTRMFGTATLSCNTGEAGGLPVNISQSGQPTVEGLVPVAQSGQVLEVNVKKIKGLHERVSDLVATIVSPAGTEVTLFSEICGNGSNYNVGFNDDAPNDINCPISNGSVFKPEEPFETFVGEDAQGIWRIILKDVDSGNGGTFDLATIEICSNSSLDQPVLINNNVLQLPPESRQLVKVNNLLCEDADNLPEEIKYILVSVPAEGKLYLNATLLNVGDTFNQKDIDDNRIRYEHNTGSLAVNDLFSFTVTDEQGGWIGITDFDIEIDPSFTSSTKDIGQLDGIRVFPNPAQSIFFVDIINPDVYNYQINVFDIDGKNILTAKDWAKRKEIDIQNLPSGTYLVELISGEDVFRTKLIKVQ